MRRVEQLINDIKFQTNEQSNRFSDERFIKIFNDAQDEIARIINVKSSAPNFFQKNYTTDLISGQIQYDLPSDVYAENSVNAVFKKAQSGVYAVSQYETLRQIGVKELGKSYGYYLDGASVVLSQVPISNVSGGLLVNYTRRLPKLSPRFGTISNISGQDITITGFNAVEITDFSDYICIVDKYGEIVDQGLEVDSWDSVTGVITVTGTITGLVNQYVVIGEYSTSNSQLPVECETYLTMYCERMVHYINSSSTDLRNITVFSEQERADIVELFADNESDTKYPQIVDDTYLN